MRGMATLERARGRGAGSLILRELLAYADRSGCEVVWLNARPRAVPFYARAGFQAVGPPFDLPGLGPHVLMERSCRRA